MGEGSQGQNGNTYAIIRMGDNGSSEHNRQLLEKLLSEFQDKAEGNIECWFIK